MSQQERESDLEAQEEEEFARQILEIRRKEREQREKEKARLVSPTEQQQTGVQPTESAPSIQIIPNQDQPQIPAAVSPLQSSPRARFVDEESSHEEVSSRFSFIRFFRSGRASPSSRNRRRNFFNYGSLSESEEFNREEVQEHLNDMLRFGHSGENNPYTGQVPLRFPVPPAAIAAQTMNLLRRAQIVKLLALVDIAFSIFWLGTPMWWLGAGLFFGLLGYYGASALKRPLLLAYVIFLVLSLAARITVLTIALTQGTIDVVSFSLLVAISCIELVVIRFVAAFYRDIPRLTLPLARPPIPQVSNQQDALLNPIQIQV